MALVFTMLCRIVFFNCICIKWNSDYVGNKTIMVFITYEMVISSFLHVCTHYKDETTLVAVNVITN